MVVWGLLIHVPTNSDRSGGVPNAQRTDMRLPTREPTRAVLVLLLAAALTSTLLSTTAGAGVQSVSPVDGFDGEQSAGPSMVLDAEDNPVVAYVDPSSQRLRVLRCDDPACVGSGETIATEGVVTSGMGWPSLALSSEGFPVVAYANGAEILVLRCNDLACKGSDSLVGIATESVGFPSLALTTNNLPVVSYVDQAFELKVVACTSANCVQRFSPVSPIGSQEVGTVPSLAVDPNGLPIIAHTLYPNGELQVIRCLTAGCRDGVISTRVNDPHVTADLELVPTGGGQFDIYVGSVVMPPNGIEQGFGDSRVYRCNNTACSSLVWAESPTLSGYRQPYYPDFAWSDNGWVVAVADLDVTRRVLVASMDPETVPNEFTDRATRIMAPDVDGLGLQIPSLRMDAAGNAAIATVTDGGIRIIRCNDAGCIPTCNGQLVTVDVGAGQVGAEGIDYIEAGGFDVVRGTPGPDTVRGGKIICGQGGDDDITADRGASVFGGAGNDVIRLDGSRNFATGGPGNDRLIGANGRDRLFGGPGNDVIDGRGGVDRISGGDGNDTLFGSWGDDKLFGNLGRDTLDGGAGNDILKGGAWLDSVDGGEGDDDRCGIVAGEIRLNCERGVFGI